MLRNFYQSDIHQLLRIEQAVHVAPWNEDTFKACFQMGYQGWVVEVEQSPVGFIVVSLNKEECHILNLCVAAEFQHQGLGQLLLSKALNHAKHEGTSLAYLEVRRSNSRAIKLYEKMDFHLIGERKDYYPTVAGYEDALIFARSLQDEWF